MVCKLHLISFFFLFFFLFLKRGKRQLGRRLMLRARGAGMIGADPSFAPSHPSASAAPNDPVRWVTFPFYPRGSERQGWPKAIQLQEAQLGWYPRPRTHMPAGQLCRPAGPARHAGRVSPETWTRYPGSTCPAPGIWCSCPHCRGKLML